jgi:hypothetical protein
MFFVNNLSVYKVAQLILGHPQNTSKKNMTYMLLSQSWVQIFGGGIILYTLICITVKII